MNNTNSITLIKIKPPNGEQPITPADLEKWRDIFMKAQFDPDFKVFTHEAVTIETINSDFQYDMMDIEFFDKVIKEKENVKLNLSIRECVHLTELECENFDKDSPIKIAAIAMIACENLSKETNQ